MYCRKNNRAYLLNQYRFLEERPGYPAESLMDCPPGLYVRRVRPNLFTSGEKFIKCFDPDVGFPEEIENYLQLGSFPHLPKYYGYYQTPAGICMLIENLPQAQTFGDLTGTAPDNWEDIVQQAFATLDYIHSRGLVHGDLNAENLLLTPSGKFYLIDFERMLPITLKNLQNETGDLIFHLWALLDGIPPAEVILGMEEGNFYPLIEYIEEKRGKYSQKFGYGIDLLLIRFHQLEK